MKNQFKYFLFSVCSLVLSFVFTSTVLAKTDCTILTQNLSHGATNSNSGFQVTSLQNFLYASSYLSVSPTGRYGDLTVAAVKKFQSVAGVNSIGVVGPATRAAIKKISCSTSTISTTTSNATAPSLCPNGMTLFSNCATAPSGLASAVITTIPTSLLQNYPISSPSTGTKLTTGQKYSIQWTGGNNQPSIDILLKDQNEAGAGYVAASLSGTTNSYNWTVGNVSIAGQQDAVVPPGDYQLSVVDDASFGSTFNIKSGIFSITEAPLYIVHILPTQAPADGKTTVVLYGSGFSSLTRVTLTGPYPYNPTIIPQFVSSDGSFIWFYVPQYITAGQYQVSVSNSYSSLVDTTATSTPSNSVNLQVNQATQ